MRIVVVMLCFLCAALSGWTSALGQTQQLGQTQDRQALHQQHPAGHIAASAASGCEEQRSHCGKSGQQSHPLLCAACYAISVDDPFIQRSDIANARIAPALQANLADRPLKPRFPPPKTLPLL